MRQLQPPMRRRAARVLRASLFISAFVVVAATACNNDESDPNAPSSGQTTAADGADLSRTSRSVSGGYYVAANGSSRASGSASSPWDLRSVLSGSKRVPSGATIWMRGGTYKGEFTSQLNGVVLRQAPGERATIDGSLYVAGSNTTYWGFEVMSSNPGGSGKMGVNVRAPGTKLVNLVVHDAGMSGIGTWSEAPNSEVYGCIVYNNGTHSNLDHGIYAQNQSGTKLLRDNILFNNLAYGFHLYTSSGQYERNVTLEGNVSFNNGTLGSYGWRPDFFVGGETAASGIVIRNNYSYRNDKLETADLGWYHGATPQDLTLTDNYFVGTVHFARWRSLTQRNNVIITNAAVTKVVVRPNAYESGRANVVVYNWGRQSSVSVNLSGVLRSGDKYEIRNVLAYYGTPVAKGTYGGGSVTVPLSSMSAPRPIGRSLRSAPATAPTFFALVVQRAT